jgi:hypothetical protein
LVLHAARFGDCALKTFNVAVIGGKLTIKNVIFDLHFFAGMHIIKLLKPVIWG